MKRLFMIFVLLSFSSSFAWYINIGFRWEKELRIGPLRAHLTYTYELIEKKERGILLLKLTNESKDPIKLLEIFPEATLSIPGHEKALPASILPESSIYAVITLPPEKLQKIQLTTSQGRFEIDLRKLKERKEALIKEWFERKILRLLVAAALIYLLFFKIPSLIKG